MAYLDPTIEPYLRYLGWPEHYATQIALWCSQSDTELVEATEHVVLMRVRGAIQSTLWEPTIGCVRAYNKLIDGMDLYIPPPPKTPKKEKQR